MKQINNFINGEFIHSHSGETLPIKNPATNQIEGTVVDSDFEDLQLAVQYANKASKTWKNTPTKIRSKCLNNWAKLIKENTKELAQLESIDTGKPLWACEKIDIPRSQDNLEFLWEYNNFFFQ